MSIRDKIDQVQRIQHADPKHRMELSKDAVIALCASWATIEVSDDDKFYYKASAYEIGNIQFYRIEQNGLRITSNDVEVLACAICIVGGVVTKKTETETFRYTPDKPQNLFFLDSSERVVVEHFNSTIWMLPIIQFRNVGPNQMVDANLIKDFRFAELVALTTLTNGNEVLAKLISGREKFTANKRFTGVYSKIWSCLAQKKYSIQEIAYETGLPVSTLSRLKIGKQSVMEFVRFYRHKQIIATLKQKVPDSVAQAEGFSSKYKMFDFLNRGNENKSIVHK